VQTQTAEMYYTTSSERPQLLTMYSVTVSENMVVLASTFNINMFVMFVQIPSMKMPLEIFCVHCMTDLCLKLNKFSTIHQFLLIISHETPQMIN
jgi:hypothetical protein